MANNELKNFGRPDESRDIDHGHIDLVNMSDGVVGYGILQPGWIWREHIQPLVKGEWCQERHVGYSISGRLHVKTAGGDEYEIGPGDVYVIEPGHEGWVVGNEPHVGVDWSGVANFGKPRS